MYITATFSFPKGDYYRQVSLHVHVYGSNCNIHVRVAYTVLTQVETHATETSGYYIVVECT